MENKTAHHAKLLPVMEVFYTLQGEGYHQGKASHFIRLAGCDVGCFWCDVKESWEEEKHTKMSVHQIVSQLPLADGRFVVITGGEPLMHDLDTLTKMIQQAGFLTHVETSGTHPLSGSWDWICFSPKRFKKPLKEYMQVAHELKVVITSSADFKWAESFESQVNKDCKLFLQPEWDKTSRILPKIITYIKENPQWCMSLQTHKYMNIP